MCDMVSEDVGIGVPTRSLPVGHGAIDAWGYLTNRLSYAQYSNNISAMTEVDLPALTEAIVTLASDPIKRKAMGAAGLKRVKEQFSWKAIIPQYQDLWGELSSIRAHAETGVTTLHLHPNPTAPSPMRRFKAIRVLFCPRASRLAWPRAAHQSLKRCFRFANTTGSSNPLKSQPLYGAFLTVSQRQERAGLWRQTSPRPFRSTL